MSDAAPSSLPAGIALAAHGALLQRARQSAGLALVVTIYMLAGFLVREKLPLIASANAFAVTYATQFVVAWLMLWVIAWGLGSAQQVATRGRWRLAATVLAAALAGSLPQSLAYLAHNPQASDHAGALQFMSLWSLSLAALLVAAYVFTERSRAAAQALHDAQVQRVALESELAAARLQLLQAQVEPHFIFNALANVRRLLRTDSAAARTLLADLLRYLEEALPRLRDERTTLGREAELVRAFLAVHQVRMGARLAVEIDVPAELGAREVPPMALLTLVENALKHGLQPLVGSGTIRVAARADAGRLVLTVADSGVGMGSGSGHGTGLANLRARLKSMYGAAASLTLALNEPRGVIATITLPERSP